MSSTIWRGRELLGSQRPRVWSAASATTSAGGEAVALAELAGVECMPWESFVAEHALGQCVFGPGPDDWRWAAFEVLLLVSRQNGKGTCIEVVELYVLFALGLNVYHTAHLMKTSRKAFKRLWGLIQRTPALRRRVSGKPRITAEEIVVELTNGAFIVFMARGQRAGRGLDDCDVLILDEALFLEARTVEAILPTMSTRPHPLVIYASSAGVAASALLRALRKRLHDRDPALTGFDWSVDPELVKAPGFDPVAVEVVAQANPSLGALISMDYVLGEYRALVSAGSLQGYLRERLGVFDEDPAAARPAIAKTRWAERGGLLEEAARPTVGLPAFAVARPPDELGEDWSAIGVAVRDDLGQVLVQVVEYRPGSAWVPGRCAELVADREGAPVLVAPDGPAGFLIEQIEAEGVAVTRATPRQVAHWTARFVAGVATDPAWVRHYDQRHLDVAVGAAGTRPAGDGGVTLQRRGELDISPLESVVLAAGGLPTPKPPAPEPPLPLAVASSSALPETAGLSRVGF